MTGANKSMPVDFCGSLFETNRHASYMLVVGAHLYVSSFFLFLLLLSPRVIHKCPPVCQFASFCAPLPSLFFFFFFSCRFCYWNVQFALVLYTVIGRTSRKFSKLSFYIPFHLHGGSIVPLTSKTLYFVIGSQLGFHSTLCLPPRDLACCFLSSKWADLRDAVIVNWGALSDCNQRLILGGLILAPVHDMGSREGFKVV